MLSCREEITALTKQLVQKESIVNTTGEKNISDSIYSYILSLPYFQQNPTHVIKQQTIHDEKERYNVIAYVKGRKNESNQTVLLMGHFDTVGVEDFNHLKDKAFSPQDLKSSLKEEELPSTVKKHLLSGKFMFGRGSLDMKSGVASHLYLLNYYSQNIEDLEGNIAVVLTCNEEDNSTGILSALKVLHQLRDEQQFNYVAAINADFVSPRYEGDNRRYIYKGTVGKLLPSFFITGAETHVGSAFEGLDPNYLAAYLTQQINYNPGLCNTANGETPLPPVSLKQTDLKPFYDVQTALSAFVYYNFFLHSWSPKKILSLLKEQAKIAFQKALDDYKERYESFCALTNQPIKPIPWKVRVLTFEEMNEELESTFGYRYISHMREFKQSLNQDATLDLRMYSARVVEEAWKWMSDKSPAIILFSSSLYSPRVKVTGSNNKEKRLLQALESAIEKTESFYDYPIVTKTFYPYISDMSFIAMSDNEEEIEAVIKNNPSWGTKHYIHYEEIRKLNIPVINIGPYGYDAHKKFERVELEYSHHIVPNLTKLVIDGVLSNNISTSAENQLVIKE